MTRRLSIVPNAIFAPLLAATAFATAPLPPCVRGDDAPPSTIAPREALALAARGRGGRVPFATDAVAARIARGAFAMPKAGASWTLPDGSKATWEPLKAAADGSFATPGRGGATLVMNAASESSRVMILEASHHGAAWIGGGYHVGDVYGTGYARVPVELKAGDNPLVIWPGRGPTRVKLVAPRSDAQLDLSDLTAPDVVAGLKEALAGVVVINASRATLRGATIESKLPDGSATTSNLPAIPPLSTRKVAVALFTRPPANQDAAATELPVRLTLRRAGASRPLDEAELKLRVRGAGQTFKRTFVSKIDGSVQYYAVNPERGPRPAGDPPPALVLTLHGAGVEAIGQADSYASKSWARIVAATNRRPFGFDWEDWGRLDALEVLEAEAGRAAFDPRRVYLTGHSMGGHGTWQVGATYPDRFAAIGPSAGWVSFASYVSARSGGGGEASKSAVRDLFRRAGAASDTAALATNYAGLGVYILHGDADDNVPVSEARSMRTRLGTFHHDWSWHEQPGAGHWWDDDRSGVACVDWPPMFDLFARRTIPEPAAVARVDFKTASPGVSSRSSWVELEQQVEPFQISAATIEQDIPARRFKGTTENVARLALDVRQLGPGGDVSVDLDGQKLGPIALKDADGKLRLARVDGRWSVAGPLDRKHKGPSRSGPFKDAFRNRMIFVYGTKGDAEAASGAYAKARYDAETFWYRGNGAVDLVADVDFDPRAEPDRNVILYGNADTNAAWAALLGESPIQVRAGVVQVGARRFEGGDVGVLMIRPRPGSAVASVGAAAGSGAIGARLLDRLPYFMSGVAYPDWVVCGPETLANGLDGVLGAGYFGNDWSLNPAATAWRP